MGTITPPAAWMASAAEIHSTRLGANTAPRSPDFMPIVARKSAAFRICLPNAPHVTARQSPSGVGSMKRTRDARSASVSNTARGAILGSRYGVMSMTTSPGLLSTRGGGFELLFQIEHAAVQLVEQVQRALLIALRRQAELTPHLRLRLVCGGAR